jgi:hypothetical protein
MKLERIQQADLALRRLESRMGAILERSLHSELLDAHSIVQEVCHFAVCFDDAAHLEKDGHADKAAQIREEAITRLVQTLRPD